MKPDPAQVAAAIALLERIAEDRSLLAHLSDEERVRLEKAAGRVAHPDAKQERKGQKALRKKIAAERRAREEAALDQTGMRAAQREAVFATPALAPPPKVDAVPERELERPRDCYICKDPFTRIHHFYDALCPACGDFNWEKRNQTADLRGRVALITGARVKIGYHAAIKLLRAGAHVVVTTRFARDAAARFAKEPEFPEWERRLEIYGLDLRHTPSVERLADHLQRTLPRLDFILHNACQTVRRPPAFYAHLLEREAAPLAALPPGEATLVAANEELRGAVAEPAELSQKALTPEDRLLLPGVSKALFPEGRLDQDLQQVDLREMNSWRLRLHEVPTIELLEVHLVNAVAPFVLSSRLKALMLKHRTNDKHIVNVSAMEGQFNRSLKTENHPHTNMAKAALNMLTRTSAQDYAKDGIFMNSVDTGWVTDEDPQVFAEKKAKERGGVFRPPLDVVDGAARIVDPIFHGVRTGEHVWGKFLKDYRPTPW